MTGIKVSDDPFVMGKHTIRSELDQELELHLQRTDDELLGDSLLLLPINIDFAQRLAMTRTILCTQEDGTESTFIILLEVTHRTRIVALQSKQFESIGQRSSAIDKRS